MSYKYEFILTPRQGFFQNGSGNGALDTEVDALAAELKLALDEVVPYFRANSMKKIKISPPTPNLVRYDLPWELNQVAPTNVNDRWEY